MDIINIYLIGGLVILVLMLAMRLLSLILKDSSIVDIFWGIGFVITAWVYFILSPEGFIDRKYLITTLTAIWGLRLSIYIIVRNWGHGEDFRYQKWCEEAGGRWWWRSFFRVFLLQGILMWIISIPLLAVQVSPWPARIIWLDYFGAFVWGVGFFFKAVGDWQLMRFWSNPDNKGELLKTGLWRTMVGVLADRRSRRGLVVCFQPIDDESIAEACLRGDFA